MKFEPWMKTTLIVVGVVLLIAMVVFLYLLIAGADESRKYRNTNQNTEEIKDDNN